MNDNDKKPKEMMNLLKEAIQIFDAAGTTNVKEVNFKNNPTDIIQTVGAEVEAVLITFDRDKGEIKLFHNGVELDKAVFAKKFRANVSFYSLFDTILEKFEDWKTAWMH
tara:strand:+ start:251 stop:577 length:327 start_codon:yes stop_codon:yes gene_type:complete